MDAQERADDIKSKLQAAEDAHPNCPLLAALHQSLADGLAEQGEVLGLTDSHRAALAGEPKE
jgi:hypothetical protein